MVRKICERKRIRQRRYVTEKINRRYMKEEIHERGYI